MDSCQQCLLRLDDNLSFMGNERPLAERKSEPSLAQLSDSRPRVVMEIRVLPCREPFLTCAGSLIHSVSYRSLPMEASSPLWARFFAAAFPILMCSLTGPSRSGTEFRPRLYQTFHLSICLFPVLLCTCNGSYLSALNSPLSVHCLISCSQGHG